MGGSIFAVAIVETRCVAFSIHHKFVEISVALSPHVIVDTGAEL